MSRDTLLLVIGTNRDGWMPTFGFASHHIATAVADGRITDEDLERYKPYDDDDSCRALAHKAGLQFDGEADDGVERASSYGGRLTHVSTEDVSISLDALKALKDEPLRAQDGIWYLYEDQDGVESVPTTIEAVEAARVEHVKTYQDAARVMLEGDTMYANSRV